MSWDPPSGIGDVNADCFLRWMDSVEKLLEEIRDRLPERKAPSSEPGAAPSG